MLDFKKIFDESLASFVGKKIKSVYDIVAQNKIFSYVSYVSDYIFSGWKRIRPYVCYLTYAGFGGKNIEEIVAFSRIFELFHTMALIHDDFIDKSDKRHNIQTVHCFINSSFDNLHIANWQAVLVWDLVLNWMYELLFSHYDFGEKELNLARKQIFETIQEVILGEMIDVDMMLWNVTTNQEIQKKNLYKTARYTFARPMLVWAILAWVDEENKSKIFELWEQLGLAFQIRDDLLDLTNGDPTKSWFSDVQEGQQTFFTQFILENWTRKQSDFLKSCLGRKLSTGEIMELQAIFDSSGAIELWKQKIIEHIKKSNEIFDEISYKRDSEFKKLFLKLIDKIAN